MKDSLGDRMKSRYEDRFRHYLPRRTNVIVRVDGKAFHTYTRGMTKPFDYFLTRTMIDTMDDCRRKIQGCKLTYHQSDEVSFLLTDYDNINSELFFDGNIQKIVSVISSMFTAYFEKNKEYNSLHVDSEKLALFDARVFIIPEPSEVINYFLWRIRDCSKNSISSVAQHYFSHKSLQGLNSTQLLDKLWKEEDIDWHTKYDNIYKNGSVSYVDKTEPEKFDKDRNAVRGVTKEMTTYEGLKNFFVEKEILPRTHENS